MDLSSDQLFELGGQFLFAIALGTSTLAFLMSSIFWLRIFMFVSYMCYAIFHYFFTENPYWLEYSSEVLLGLINVVMILILYLQENRVKLSDKEKAIYENQFSGLSLLEFDKLLKVGEWEVYEPGTHLIEDGKVVDHLYYVYGGDVEILRPDGVKIVQPQGSFIGEISFNLQQPASASVFAKDMCVILQWNQESLRGLFRSVPQVKAHLEALLAQHMAKKLSEAKEREEQKAAQAAVLEAEAGDSDTVLSAQDSNEPDLPAGANPDPS